MKKLNHWLVLAVGSVLTTIAIAKLPPPPAMTDEQKAELLNEADKCYIHRMIEGQWNIDKSVELK